MRGFLPPCSDRAIRPLTVAVIAADPALIEDLHGCLRDLPLQIVYEGAKISPRLQLLSRLDTLRPEVIFFELDIDRKSAVSLIRALKSALPDSQVIALSRLTAPEAILEVFREGIADYLCPPLRNGIWAVLERLSAQTKRAEQKHEAGGAVLGFLSAKGGCGATTIACHVAANLQTLTCGRVLLADLDANAGMVGFLTGAERRYTLADAVRNVTRLDASYWKALVSKCAGLEVITAPRLNLLEACQPASGFGDVLRFVRSQYSFTIADLGRGLNPLVSEIAGEFDTVFLVTTPERMALHMAARIVRFLTGTRSPRVNIRLIVNRAAAPSESAAAEIEESVGLPVYCEIPGDGSELYAATLDRKLLTARSRLGKHFTRLSRALAGIAENTEARQPLFSVRSGWLPALGTLLK